MLAGAVLIGSHVLGLFGLKTNVHKLEVPECLFQR